MKQENNLERYIMSDPVLVIFPNIDLMSMNGKTGLIAAHCAHAASDLATRVNTDSYHNKSIVKLYEKWNCGFGFGTTIVKDPLSGMFRMFPDTSEFLDNSEIIERYDFTFGYVLDPTYPFRVPVELARHMEDVEWNEDIKKMSNLLYVSGTRMETTAMWFFYDRESEDPETQRYHKIISGFELL